MSDQRLTIDIETRANVSGAVTAQSELRKVEQEATKADQALSNMGKGATAKLPLSASMQELLSSAQSARNALTTMAENSGLDGLRSNLQQSSQLIDEIRSKASLGLALGQGGNYDTSAFKDLSSYASHMSGAIKGATGSMREFGNETARSASTVKSSNGIFSNFGGSLMRIAKLRLLRGIVRSVTSAFKEGVSNIYQYSAAMNSADASHVKSSMDGLASAMLKMKNTIGSALAPVLSGIIPIIQKIVGWFTAAVNAIAQFFAVLNGQTTYTRAKDVSVAFQDTASDIGAANTEAKKLQRTLLGFDELNVLESPDNGGGGGGGNGGGGSVSPSDMFEEAPIDTTGIQGAINKIAKALKPIYDIVKDVPSLVEECFNILKGALEGDYNQIRDAMNRIQKLFQKNETWKNLFKGGYEAMAEFDLFFTNLGPKIKLAFLEAVRGLIEACRPVLEFLGIDVDGALKNIDKSIANTTNTIEKNKKKVRETTQAYKDWADGKISFDGLTASIAVVEGAFGKGIKSVKGMQSVVKTLENNGFDASMLTKGMMQAKTAGERAQIGFNNLKTALNGLEKRGIDTSKIRKELGLMGDKTKSTKKDVENLTEKDKELTGAKFSLDGHMKQLSLFGSSSKDAKDKVDKTKQAITSLGSSKLNLSGVKGQMDGIKSSSSSATSNVNSMRDKLTALGKVSISTKSVNSSIGSIGTASYLATSNINGTSNALKGIGKVKISTGGLSKFFTSLSSWITNAYNKTVSLGYALIGIGNVNTTKKKTSGKKNGGYVTRAEGGFIPRFDGGGISSADVFLANENGMAPELVGHIGNRTAVANQGQMVDAMAAGVYRAMSELMGQNSNTEVNVFMDGQKVASVVNKANRTKNRRMNVRVN